ncbi:hypothetical protein PG291_10045 [Riemerella anatipestifer]|nr:hypothetical protein [Riemerella anatipestifer]
MNCIICDKNANAKGSHIVPASLIQNCVGKHYREESYKIDAKNVNIDTYFGRDNLKNTSTEIKENHYKKDYILCQECEDKLATIENNFSRNFLQKFRDERYNQNFKIYKNQFQVEILIPLRYDKDELYFYLYSLIHRFCVDNGQEDGEFFLEESDLINLKSYINEYLYGDKTKAKEYIANFNLVIHFDKSNSNGSFVASSNHFNNPYIFYFCEPILLLFIGKLSKEAKQIYEPYINNVSKNDELKIIVNPEFYDSYRKIMAEYLAETFMTNAIHQLCNLNHKRYEENLVEFVNEMTGFEGDDNEKAIKTFEKLKQKYCS